MKMVEFETGLQEETAESKSCIADVEVKMLGFDAMIKILSRRRPGQLIKTIAALEDLQLNVLHTNITTIEQAVLYSFNVKVRAFINLVSRIVSYIYATLQSLTQLHMTKSTQVASEVRFTAEDIASSVQQIFGFIHANSSV